MANLPIGSGKKSPLDVEVVRSNGLAAIARGAAASAGQLLTSASGAIDRKLEQWFGPLEPMPRTAPVDVDVRQADYPAGYNRQTRPRGYEAITFGELRSFASLCETARLAIETRKDQVSRHEWKFQLKRMPGETKKDNAKRQAEDPRVAWLTAFFTKPDGRFRFAEWMRMIIEDRLVCDAVAIYPRKTLDGSRPYTLEVIDPATIAIKIDEDGRHFPDPPAIAFQQILHGAVAKELTSADLIYEISNPRTGKFYGLSPIEQTIILINTAIRRSFMQLAFYTDGNMPEGICEVPKEWTSSQIKDFQKYWDGYFGDGNVQNRSHLVFAPSGKVTFTKKDDLKGEFDEWIARVIMFAFSLPPTPFIRQLNRSTGETSQEASQDEGLAPLLKWTSTIVTVEMVQRFFGIEDIEFVWVEEQELDQTKQAAIDVQHVTNGIRPIDEVREERGWDALGVPVGYPTASGFVLLPTPENQATIDAQDQAKADAAAAKAKSAGSGGDEEKPAAKKSAGYTFEKVHLLEERIGRLEKATK